MKTTTTRDIRDGCLGPATSARPTETVRLSGFGDRLVMGAFRLAGHPRQFRRWAARRLVEGEYAINGPLPPPEPWHRHETDLRCWTLSDRHAS
jgi:hypothetical protein